MRTLRDTLALERTRLANERTFLAYMRTALSLVAGAAVLFQFFSSIQAYIAIAWFLLLLGFMILCVGIFRFARVRSTLREGRLQAESPTDSGSPG